MIPGMNPRQMQKMMQKMGIKQHDLNASKVVITLDDKELIFENPQVSKVNMMGQETYQVVGTPIEQERDSTPEISDEDIEIVVNQTGVTIDEARKAIETTKGDLAEAIITLSSKE